MKKTIVIFFSSLLIISMLLTGCQSDKISCPPEPLDSNETPETSPYTVNESGKLVYNLYKETEDFGFTLESSSGSLKRGETVKFYVSVTNLTNEMIIAPFSGLKAYVRLVCKTPQNEYYLTDEYIIYAKESRVIDVSTQITVANGEKSETNYDSFLIPEHAIPGKYSVECSFNGSKVVFEDIFTLD